MDKWEISSDRVKVLYDERLGSGAFGTVFKGTVLSKWTKNIVQNRFN